MIVFKTSSVSFTSKPISQRLTYVSAILIFAALSYSLLSFNALQGQVQPSVPHSEASAHPKVPFCNVWGSRDPSWRREIPPGVPANGTALPLPRLGLAEVMNRNAAHGCVPASERLGPFGHSSSENDDPDRPWDELRWGELQTRCAYKHFATGKAYKPLKSRLQRAFAGLDDAVNSPRLDDVQTGRTAVVLRSWDRFVYTDNQKAWLRTLATELALDTGGRYQLFLLVDVQDQTLDLQDDTTYNEVLRRSIPVEFQDMTFLWNQALLREWFPKVGVHNAQDQMYQALQVFSFSFPEFDYVWQLEMDVRFTGNVARMLDDTVHWAEAQPRKNLWERNGRWYIPGLANDYTSFSTDVDNELEGKPTVWGPAPNAQRFIQAQGPTPPDRSHTTWGIGEPPDLITFAPMVDPNNTHWIYEKNVYGFSSLVDLPRRMAIISMTRTSRRLLRLITSSQRANGSWVVSESTPETWSFLHGLKAVYAPHLISFNLYTTDSPSPQQMDERLHKGPWWSRAGGDRAGFLWAGAELGLWEGRWLRSSYFYWPDDGPRLWGQYTNGSCGEAMLLHPVKQD